MGKEAVSEKQPKYIAIETVIRLEDDEDIVPVGTRGVGELEFDGEYRFTLDGYEYGWNLTEECYRVLPESELPLEHRCKLKFGNQFHSLFTLKEPFKAETQCYCCKAEATRRVEVNIWGSVTQYDMCDDHAMQYDGMCCDSVTKAA